MAKSLIRSLEWGILLVLIGVVFLVGNLRGDHSLIVWAFKWSPALLIWVGLRRGLTYFWPGESESERNRSLACPLALIALGLLILLPSLGVVPNGLHFIGLWWPVVLLAMGLGKLADAMIPGRTARIKGGEVVFVVFLFLFGSGIRSLAHLDTTFLSDAKWHMGSEEFPLLDLLRPHAVTQNSGEAALQGATQLRIDAQRANVILQPSFDQQVHLKWETRVYADSQEEAQRISQAYKVTGNRFGEALVLSLQSGVPGGILHSARIHVMVPAGIPVQVQSTRGDVEVEGLMAPLTVTSGSGDVNIRSLQGSFQFQTDNGDLDGRRIEGNVTVRGQRCAVDIADVTGNVDVENRNASLTIRSVTGSVALRCSHSEVELERIRGTVNVTDQGENVRIREITGLAVLNLEHGDVELEKLHAGAKVEGSLLSLVLRDTQMPVEMNLTKSSVRAVGVSGPLKISDTIRRVKLENVTGPVDVTNSRGTIEVSGLPADPSVLWSLQNTGQDIVISVPDFPAGRRAWLESVNGLIHTSYEGGGWSLRKESGRQILSNYVGGDASRATLRCRTEAGGKIELKRSEHSSSSEDSDDSDE